jgi:hypothetical protein
MKKDIQYNGQKENDNNGRQNTTEKIWNCIILIHLKWRGLKLGAYKG